MIIFSVATHGHLSSTIWIVESNWLKYSLQPLPFYQIIKQAANIKSSFSTPSSEHNNSSVRQRLSAPLLALICHPCLHQHLHPSLLEHNPQAWRHTRSRPGPWAPEARARQPRRAPPRSCAPAGAWEPTRRRTGCHTPPGPRLRRRAIPTAASRTEAPLAAARSATMRRWPCRSAGVAPGKNPSRDAQKTAQECRTWRAEGGAAHASKQRGRREEQHTRASSAVGGRSSICGLEPGGLRSVGHGRWHSWRVEMGTRGGE
jgi:hypothetical protein